MFKPKIFLTDYRKVEPTTANEALKHSHWRKAMEEEYSTLLANDTWDLVSPPSDKKIMGCKWVFKVEQNTYGSIARYKACLVAKGFHQTTDIDYFETLVWL